jgi:3-hydroxy-3-methylglutaryl CoA synthase
MIGVTSIGGYIPRLRLSRKLIAQNVGWYSPAIWGLAQGEKAIANWDEDALSMAVAASQDCILGRDKQSIDGVYAASTTFPFADRLNAGVLVAALNLNEEKTASADFTGCTKAGTTAMISALEAIQSGGRNDILVAASDQRRTKMATNFEMFLGDGAAALLMGRHNVIAEFKGSYSMSCDFIDHYRGAGKEFDYTWEERWVRDEGYGKIIPKAITEFLEKSHSAINDFDKVIYPCYFSATHRNIAKKLGLGSEKLYQNFHELSGDTGTAHPLVMFVAALEEAKPGDKLLLVGFGQGCDVLSFEVTEAITTYRGGRGIRGSLAQRTELTNYTKFLKFRELVAADLGIRGEANPNASLNVQWRNRKRLIGLVGSRCKRCGTPQFSFTPVCVNPTCNAVGEMEDYEFSGRKGTVAMYTGDMLAASVDPPAIYGIIDFEGGGRMLADFTDCTLEDIKVGVSVEMSFRLRAKDNMRGFNSYFWKAVPQATEKGV